ncbi:MAG: hypothetical protein ABFS43_19475 [Thermodesulfobacteriota bacterium]
MLSSNTFRIQIAAVFLISISSIMFEILLARFFSISQWNHLSFMIISMALFGFAASGTLLSIRGISGKSSLTEKSDNRIRLHVLLYSSSTLVSFLILNRMPLDYMELPVDSFQILLLLAACLLIAVPFFYAGMVISCAYMTMPERTGSIYFFNMAGSGLGALVVLLLLPFTNEGILISIAVILPLLTTMPLFKSIKNKRHKPIFTAFYILTGGIALAILMAAPQMLQIRPSPYKSLSQLLLFPETIAAHEQTSLRGRVETVDSPYIRFAPGLSLKFHNSLPRQKAVFIDGDNRLVLPTSSSGNNFVFQRHTLAYAGYLIPEKLRNILVVQNSGGSAIACAFSAGAEKLQALEKNPILADLLAAIYPIQVSSKNPRTFLNSCIDRFDVIHIESWGASLPGASALTQDYSFTKDAFKLYLSCLSQDGVVVVSRRLLLPPSNMLRLCAAAGEALLSYKAAPLERHIAIVRNWDTFTMIVSLKPIQNIKTVRDYAENLNFDLVWPQKTDSPSLNRFNTFEKPFHYLKIKELFAAYRSNLQNRFFNQYPLDIAPQTDDRPFPDKFFKWRKGAEIHKMTGSRLYTLLLSGEIVVVVVLGAAMLTALFLLFLPRFAAGARHGNISFNLSVYFLSVGAGFILAELFFIHYYTLIFGDPVLSFAAVLSSLLVFSGAGGLVSLYLNPRQIKTALLILATVLGIMCITADQALHSIVMLPSPLRQSVAIVALMPAGLLLGMPFPLGMRFMLKHPRQRAYAWAANGCASVVSSVIAVQIALSIGLTAILWCAVGAYALAWLTANPANT